MQLWASNNRGQIVLASGLTMGIVGLILTIACVNLARNFTYPGR
jgi:Kef-type K+ transport system membrane component KefB